MTGSERELLLKLVDFLLATVPAHSPAAQNLGRDLRALAGKVRIEGVADAEEVRPLREEGEGQGTLGLFESRDLHEGERGEREGGPQAQEEAEALK